MLDPAFTDVFRERFVLARRTALRTLLERGVTRGEIDPAVDLELLLDVIFGVLWYRLLVGHAPVDDTDGAKLAGFVTDRAGTAGTSRAPNVTS